ncbi:unnamed protein product [Blepharisma stoltei]|uniref:NADH dehydrogenase [ubiquinone] 1 beta subcomplex subunit 1 n=1 Tax=Blepharisma stoltei TaxID=1481888 RepID=A0AAU9IUG4_9CILI|nr:unnamed protein product [Blepharisma stoltei]
MANPLQQFANQYFKRPDSWKGLALLAGIIFVDSYFIDRGVRNYIFGKDGKGGEMLLCKTRIDHHEEEYREARKKWYWHQRKAKFYMPQDVSFNDKLDYKTLSYNYAHFNKFLDPADVPRHHDADAFYFNELEPEDYYK